MNLLTSVMIVASLSFTVPHPNTSDTSSPWEPLVSATLDESINRRCVKWEVNGDLDAEVSFSIQAAGSLGQVQGVRAAIYKSDGTPVEAGEILVSETRSFTFRLTTGTYFFIFDLGADDLEAPVASLEVCGVARLKDHLSGSPVRLQPSSGDIPPDPYYPPPSQIYLPGPLPLPASSFLPPPQWAFPRVETMTYLVDWA